MTAGRTDRFYGRVEAYIVVDRSRVWTPASLAPDSEGPTIYGPYIELKMADAIVEEINDSGGDAYMTELSEYTG